MKHKSLVMRYVKPLYELASKEGKEVEAENQLEAFAKTVKQNEDYLKIFSNPSIEKTDKIKLIDEISEKLNFNPLIKRFLHLLAEKNRIVYIYDIALGYNKYVLEKMNKTAVKICFARKPDINQIKKIGKILKEKFKKNISISYSVDPSLIGGFKISADNRVIDAGLQNELNQLKEHLYEKYNSL